MFAIIKRTVVRDIFNGFFSSNCSACFFWTSPGHFNFIRKFAEYFTSKVSHGKVDSTDCIYFFSLYVLPKWFISHNFLRCRPSQRSALSQVPSQVATHRKIGSQLWAGETPDPNPGLQDDSQARYHWATMPPIAYYSFSQKLLKSGKLPVFYLTVPFWISIYFKGTSSVKLFELTVSLLRQKFLALVEKLCFIVIIVQCS